jgi:hypothetical protein
MVNQPISLVIFALTLRDRKEETVPEPHIQEQEDGVAHYPR